MKATRTTTLYIPRERIVRSEKRVFPRYNDRIAMARPADIAGDSDTVEATIRCVSYMKDDSGKVVGVSLTVVYETNITPEGRMYI